MRDLLFGVGASALLFLAGCDLPRDAYNSYKKAQEDGLIVGVQESPPWVILEDGQAPTGPEAELVKDFAREHGMEVLWSKGPFDEMMNGLIERKVHIVVGGIKASSAWKDQIAFSTPVALTFGPKGKKEKRVLAVAPGEGKLLYSLDQFILARKKRELIWKILKTSISRSRIR